MHFAEDQYGFEWGSVKIQRICADEKKGWIVMSLETPKYQGVERIQIYVTKTGKVRIYDARGEWTPPSKARA
jgi:hypothetical protein